MKKSIALLLTLFLSLSLCACSSSEDKNSPSMDIKEVKNISQLSGFKIAAQSGTFHQQALAQVDGLIPSDYPEFSDLLVALKSKSIDGYVAEEPTAYSVCLKDDTLTYLPLVNNQTGFKTSENDTGIAVALKKGSDLKEKINSIIASIDLAKQDELMKQMIQLSAGEKIESLVIDAQTPTNPSRTLRIGMECAYEPYNWTLTDDTTYGCVPIFGQGKDGLYANGYDVQIARYIASQLNMDLEIYAIEWDSLIPAVQSGVVDAVVAGMSPTQERAQQVDFSDCYYNSNLVIIIRNGQ